MERYVARGEVEIDQRLLRIRGKERFYKVR
jgi:hypothetical protein